MLPTLADNVGCQPNFHRKDTNSEVVSESSRVSSSSRC
ncbi:hypothetical protein BVRB_2g046830 isoform B [Beta vulgaris subsp. vulgaris]|nr:hypothetical protein BVRB_2g046830 isoform B [Beta vulgaris subsp. vulgaris]